MQLPPADVIFSWPTPNYNNPTDVRGPGILVISGIFFPIAFLIVILRVYTRLRLSKAFGIDDIFLLLAVPPAFACTVLTCIAVTHWGWNRHIWDVKLPMVVLGLKLQMAMECLFGIAVSCTKLSLLILTRRVMSSGTGTLRHVAAVGMFIVACEGLIFNVVVICTCSPVKDYWTLSLTPQKCIDERAHLLAGGIINTMTDFLVFFLPIPTVLGLQLPRRQQILLCLLFGAGFIVCIAGTIRIWFAWKITSSYDRTWLSYGLWISSVLELDMGLICASLPACKPFFSRYLPVILGSSYSRSQRKYGDATLSGGSTSRPQKLPAVFPDENFYVASSGFNHQFSKSGPRVNSQQMLPLSYLEPSKSTQARDTMTRISHETTASSITGNGDSPAPTVATSEVGIQPPSNQVPINRAESREGLVKG